MKIYHNPRCSKSRKTLNLIKEKTSKFEIIEYTKKPLKFKEIQSLLKKLNMTPIELIRKSEKIWKNNYQNKLTDSAIKQNDPNYNQLKINKIRPRIAVCGLNPHAGEEGQIGAMHLS